MPCNMEGEPVKKRGRKSNPDRKSLSALYGESACYQLIHIMRNQPGLWTTRVTRNEEWRGVYDAMQSKYPDMEDELIKRTWLNLLNGFIYRPERWKWRRVMNYISSVIVPKYVEDAQNEANVSSSMAMGSMTEDEYEDDGLGEDPMADDDGLDENDDHDHMHQDNLNYSHMNHVVNGGVNNMSYYPCDERVAQNGGTSSAANNVVFDSNNHDDSQMWHMYEPQVPMTSAHQEHPQASGHQVSLLSQQLSAISNTVNEMMQQQSGADGGIDRLLAVLAQGVAPPKYCFGELIRDRMSSVNSPVLRWQAERRILQAVDDILDEFRRN
ncbi:hypothetical protein QR680_008702 [Steinernema hermaphroditum]|uniref:MADF domain-containing protein n=1 Tax=Steinernema hermaphroditum TaxID=289476 RepID=A0AA39IHL8_9BILA|nr:hypothetical protein QR680_008702 [Steinernema hermaphroditum]